MRALLNKVVVAVAKSNALLESTEAKPSRRGTIVSVGQDNGANLEKGAEVLFGAYSGVSFEIEGKEFIVLQEGEVLVEL